MRIDTKAKAEIKKMAFDISGGAISVRFGLADKGFIRCEFLSRGIGCEKFEFDREGHSRHALPDALKKAREILDDMNRRRLRSARKTSKVGTFGQALREAADRSDPVEKPGFVGVFEAEDNGRMPTRIRRNDDPQPIVDDADAEAAAGVEFIESKSARPLGASNGKTTGAQDMIRETAANSSNGPATSALAKTSTVQLPPVPALVEKEGTRARLRAKEMVKLVRILSMCGQQDEARGLYTYYEGYSDEAARALVAPDVRIDTYVKVRRQNFGKLGSEFRAKKPGKDERIAELEGLLRRAEARIEELEAKLLSAQVGRSLDKPRETLRLFK